MSRSILGLIVIVIIFGSSYFWYEAKAVCPIPINYKLGMVADDFGLSGEEALAAINEAESLWENATGLNLFSKNNDASMVINFIFDERQQFTNAEEALSHELEETKALNQEVEKQYTKLVAEYNLLNEEYETKKEIYERLLNNYNQEVEKWNEQGGAPQNVYDDLNQRKKMLDNELQILDNFRTQLNKLVAEINQLTETANEVVSKYNQEVEVYNNTFSENTEFTQGDFRGNQINIYQFKNQEELVLVLAHELGHALGIGHVNNPQSIMYMQMGEQSITNGLTTEDLDDFRLICGNGTTLSKIKFW